MILVGCQNGKVLNSCIQCKLRKFPHRCNVYRESCHMQKVNAWEWIKTPESSNIKAFSYEMSILRICFKNGTIYDYYGVPEFLFKEMKKAKSKGTFLNENIKRKFRTVKVE